jgi:hypothetical protein
MVAVYLISCGLVLCTHMFCLVLGARHQLGQDAGGSLGPGEKEVLKGWRAPPFQTPGAPSQDTPLLAVPPEDGVLWFGFLSP